MGYRTNRKEFLTQEPHLRTEDQKKGGQGGRGRLMRDEGVAGALKDQPGLDRKKWGQVLQAERTGKAKPVMEKPLCNWGPMKAPWFWRRWWVLGSLEDHP